ncbi:MAG: hypothetical protein POELPBGB_03179 [Bacteroidia bacterium]|nr:hypothetical protein [Bacteroidia bacterium]
MGSYKDRINAIGQEMTTCRHNCDRIINDPENGILPRCLFFDERSSDKKHLIIAIGINPGIADEKEKMKLKKIDNYEEVCKKLSGYKDHKYYERLSWLIDDLGHTGDILWTELVKCQNADKRKNPNVYTSAFCSSLYLNNEVKQALKFYKKITLLAVGKEVYDKLILMFLENKIVGVYHPRSYGYFNRMFDTSDGKRWRLRNNFKTEIIEFMNLAKDRFSLFKG